MAPRNPDAGAPAAPFKALQGGSASGIAGALRKVFKPEPLPADLQELVKRLDKLGR